MRLRLRTNYITSFFSKTSGHDLAAMDNLFAVTLDASNFKIN